MVKVSPTPQRKNDHLRINLEEDVRSRASNGLERYRLVHEALPEITLSDVDFSLTLLGKNLRAPLLISSMTGGTKEAAVINRRLAEAAEARGIAMGVGSQRAAIENPSLAETFSITRRAAPHALLFANLGAVQLNKGYGIEECRRAVEMLEADALILHLNPLQEALQPEGDTDFRQLAEKIGRICQDIEVPIIVKEVGWGISERTARLLADAGVFAIDVAGTGGTSWSQVEMHRAADEASREIAAAFADWGISTAESLLNVRRAAPQMIIFASGGLRSGVDIAKALALGATLGGMAGEFLHAANRSTEAVIERIRVIEKELQIAMFATGAKTLERLDGSRLQHE